MWQPDQTQFASRHINPHVYQVAYLLLYLSKRVANQVIVASVKGKARYAQKLSKGITVFSEITSTSRVIPPLLELVHHMSSSEYFQLKCVHSAQFQLYFIFCFLLSLPEYPKKTSI